MISPYPHLIDLNDYPVSWWKQVVDLGGTDQESPRNLRRCMQQQDHGDLVL